MRVVLLCTGRLLLLLPWLLAVSCWCHWHQACCQRWATATRGGWLIAALEQVGGGGGGKAAHAAHHVHANSNTNQYATTSMLLFCSMLHVMLLA